VVDDVIPAAGGRVLLLRFDRLSAVGAFDVRARKLTRLAHLPAPGTFVAGGAAHVVIASPDQNVIERWNLDTLNPERSGPIPAGMEVRSLAMGYDSDGPVAAVTHRHLGRPPLDREVKRLEFINPTTLDAIETKIVTPRGYSWDPVNEFRAIAAPDGSAFAIWTPTASWAFVPGGDSTRAFPLGRAGGTVTFPPPGGAGRFLCGHGLLTENLQPDPVIWMVQCLPAYDPDLFLAVHNGTAETRTTAGVTKVDLHLPGQPRPVATLPDLPEFADLAMEDRWQPAALGLYKRLHFFPWADLLVTVDVTRDRLLLRDVPLARILATAGIDYLRAASLPPATARRGETFVYEPRILTNHPPATVTLVSGPPGMTMTAAGRVEWAVPKPTRDSALNIVLGLTDASNRTANHAFRLRLTD
jgi:hypothetical protein